MGFVRQVAKLARLGDLPGIQRLCEEESYVREEVRWGFVEADREMKRDKLPPLAEPLQIGPGSPPMPSIYKEPPYRNRKRKAA